MSVVNDLCHPLVPCRGLLARQPDTRLSGLLSDATRFIGLGLRSRAALAAENLFLRKQLAFYIERKTKPRRADDATRLVLALLSKLFAWRDALVVVKPETLIAWYRKGFGLLWKRNRSPEDDRECQWKSES